MFEICYNCKKTIVFPLYSAGGNLLGDMVDSRFANKRHYCSRLCKIEREGVSFDPGSSIFLIIVFTLATIVGIVINQIYVILGGLGLIAWAIVDYMLEKRATEKFYTKQEPGIEENQNKGNFVAYMYDNDKDLYFKTKNPSPNDPDSESLRALDWIMKRGSKPQDIYEYFRRSEYIYEKTIPLFVSFIKNDKLASKLHAELDPKDEIDQLIIMEIEKHYAII